METLMKTIKGIPTKSQNEETKQNMSGYNHTVKNLFTRALEKAKRINRKYSIPYSANKKNRNLTHR